MPTATAEHVIALTNSSNLAVTISIVGVPSATGAIVNYITMPANQPQSYGNHIYVWQTTDNIVPWSKPPAGDIAVNSDSSTSTQFVNFKFEDKGYIIGYAVAPSPQAVCATIYMPAGKQNDPTAWQYANVGLGVAYVGTNLVQSKYAGLTAYLPATNKNWIGIWSGPVVPYTGDPIATTPISVDAPSSGYAILQGIPLLIGYSYTLGYFTAGTPAGRTALAATASFTVGTP
jgi:hypothetical protein